MTLSMRNWQSKGWWGGDLQAVREKAGYQIRARSLGVDVTFGTSGKQDSRVC